ncbi:hypothetical protein R4036_004584 [Salmonella enterica]|nr:hypothetical protein [Salmonella enterica]
MKPFKYTNGIPCNIHVHGNMIDIVSRDNEVIERFELLLYSGAMNEDFTVKHVLKHHTVKG